MKLTSKHKLRLWLLAGFLAPSAVLFVTTLLNINKLDPKLGDAAYHAEFKLEGRYVANSGSITLDTEKTWDGGRILRIDDHGFIQELKLARDGSLAPGLYPLFWVHLTNPIAVAGTQKKSWEARIRDDMGFIGEKGREYTVRSFDKFILWDYNLSSQASYHVGIFDGEQQVASAIYDMTCGMLFELVPNLGGWGRVSLADTDFPISRNRYVLLYAAIVFCVILLAWYASRYSKSPRDKKYEALDNLWLAGAVSAAILVDFVYDIWFFSMGDIFTLALHVGVIIILAFRFRLWILPMILELCWVIGIAFPTTGRLAPGISLCPGILMAVLIMLIYRPVPIPRGLHSVKSE